MTDLESHTASRVILATPRAIFRAMVDPEVVAKWRAPDGMSARLLDFQARAGGGYRMILTYDDARDQPGKSGEGSDIVRARFLALEPDERVVEQIQFENAGPDFTGTMTIETVLKPVTDGTKVTITATNVPRGISAEDHHKGMESSLKNLAILLE